MKKHLGSCHCGNVKFIIESDISELTTCDCSICVKKNALMTKVHESKFELLCEESALTEYNWNTKIARHFFCNTCGIYTFHRKQAQPDHYGINIFCLDSFDTALIPTRGTEGISMPIISAVARNEWPGPRES
ncbi:MAG: GFA family protein [Alphaproteobacteria bacterium]